MYVKRQEAFFMTKSHSLKKIITAPIFIFCIMILALLFTVYSSADSSQDKILIDADTVWKYLDDNTDPALGLSDITAWTESDFDDSAWKSAKGSFGSKNGELSKVGSVTPDNLINLYQPGTTLCIPTVFFRTVVTVDDLSDYSAIALRINVDDAVAIYLNGTVICDTRTTKKTNTNMYYSAGDSKQVFYIDLAQIPGVLHEGENVIAAEVHNNQSGSTDILFKMDQMCLMSGESTPIVAEHTVLNVGSSEKERNLAWFSNIEAAGEVRLAVASSVKNGVFPSEYRSFAVTSNVASNAIGKYAKSTTLTDLSENTAYAYTVVADGKTSDVYYFKTGSFDDYSFVFVGDPQISKEAHGASWADTVNKITENFDPELLISGGDQVNTPDSEQMYSYFIVDALSGVTLATTVGPGHDSSCATFGDHFHLPNLSDKYGVNTTSANYWYTYGNTLFMHLNMSDTAAATNGEHKNFIKEAIQSNPGAIWKIVVMHVSLFSTGHHGAPDYKYFEGEVGVYRPALAPVFTELDIDLVLSAHDHVYLRTHMMNGTEPSDDKVENNRVITPEGTLYLCANSSTGSKFYDQLFVADFAAYDNYEKRKSAVKFDVTDERLTLTSYFLDNMTAFDTFTIEKEPHTCQLERVEAVEATCFEGGKRAYYQCECGRTYEDAEGKLWITNISDWGNVSPKGHSWLLATCTEPLTCSGCATTLGEPLPHKYSAECDTRCDECNAEREAEPHKDTNRDGICDACGGKLPSSTALTVVSLTVAASVILGVVAFVLFRKRRIK